MQMPDYPPNTTWFTTRLRNIRANLRGPITRPAQTLGEMVTRARSQTPRQWRDQVARIGALLYPAGTCVGIEIEHLLKTGSNMFEFCPIPGSKLVGDGSVSQHHRNTNGDTVTTPDACTNPNGQEIVLMIRRDKPERLRDLCNWLKASGGLVNPTCGLHVHLDQRDTSRREALTRARRITAALPWLVQIVPPSRRNNSFCKIKMSTNDRLSLIHI